MRSTAATSLPRPKSSVAAEDAKGAARARGALRILIAGALAAGALVRPAAADLARREADFIGSMGVCVHLELPWTAYGNTALVQSELQSLGISHIRVLPPDGNLAAYQSLASAGMGFDVVMETTALSDELAALAPIAPWVDSIEGPNEIDLYPVSYNGLSGGAAAVAFQTDLFAAVRASPLLGSVPVLPFSLAGNFLSGTSPLAVYGDLSAVASEGNLHAYAPVPPFWWVTGVLATSDAPELPQVLSETGYYTLPDGGAGVDEYTQAVWSIITQLDTFDAGVVRTYLYQLMDPSVDPAQSDPQAHFGLFNTDGSPKLAATALHNLTHILGDPGATASSFTPDTLEYSISGLPQWWGFGKLLQKSGGRFDLVLWQEPQFWNFAARTHDAVQPATVTVTFDGPVARIGVFDPLVSAEPLAIYYNTNSVTVPLGTDPLVIRDVQPTATW